MNEGATIGGNDVLIVVDIQNDFCPGGALAVPRGDEVVPIVNRLATRFRNVVLTQDWHPAGHFSFASTHPGKKPFETIAAPYGPQVLWPDHCVQATPGAAFHHALQIPHAALVMRKGMERMIDSYSAFYENDHKTPTGLVGYLHERGFPARLPCRARLRFLRTLFGRGRAARGLRGFRHRRCLPRDRCRRLGCLDPRKPGGSRGRLHPSPGGRLARPQSPYLPGAYGNAAHPVCNAQIC